MKLLTPIVCSLGCILTGCYGFHVNNRSVVNYYEQKAETYGSVSNTPKVGDANVAAEKTFETASSVSTSSGASETTTTKPAETKPTEVAPAATEATK